MFDFWLSFNFYAKKVIKILKVNHNKAAKIINRYCIAGKEPESTGQSNQIPRKTCPFHKSFYCICIYRGKPHPKQNHCGACFAGLFFSKILLFIFLWSKLYRQRKSAICLQLQGIQKKL